MRMRKLWKMAARIGLASMVAISGLSMVNVGKSLAEEAPSSIYRHMEKLNRAPVAVKTESGVYIGWRLLGTDSPNTAFNLYRDGIKLNAEPIVQGTNYTDPEGMMDAVYEVRPVLNGIERPASGELARVWHTNHLDIPLRKPAGGRTPTGESYTYNANDMSVGDLDGDGQYELIVKWDPSNSKDNSLSGYTGNVYLDAYKLDGTFLWRIDLGRNIRAGAHYTQFLVYDFDSDGRAEIVAKTADGTIDGGGVVLGDPDADYRNTSGYVLSGPEFLTVFDGLTGRAMATVDYDPPRGRVSDWGDSYGNRVDRFLAAVAYLDGEHPSIVMARGYYTRSVLVAYNWRGGQLTKLWKFDSNDPGNSSYAGQGNHNLNVADVDGDGKDEIIYGAATIDHDGKGLYNTRLGHGDAMHVSDLDPASPGLEVFKVSESVPNTAGIAMWDAATGELLWNVATNYDVGRGTAGDVDPRYPGAEAWASGTAGGLFSAKGERISSKMPPVNFMIWWDGDLLREALDHYYDSAKEAGVGRIAKWDYENQVSVDLLRADGTYSNNTTKGTPNLQADLLGDWREEVIWRLEDSSALRLYTTTDVSEHRIFTMMHDPVYRLGIAWQNIAYNQPPHTGYYLGVGMEEPPEPKIRTESTGSVSGWIGNGGGKRLVGADVTLQVDGTTYSTMTNAHGYYSFQSIPISGSAQLSVSRAVCRQAAVVVDVRADGAVTQDLELECPITEITVSPLQKTVLLESQTQLNAVIAPEEADSSQITWTSSDPAVASVDGNGLVTGIAIGSATITAYANGDPSVRASSEIKVAGIPISQLEIDSTEFSMLAGSSKRIQVIITPQNATNQHLNWTSSNLAVATVDDIGEVRGIAEGTAEITVTSVDGGLSRTAVVNVYQSAIPVSAVVLDAPAYFLTSDYFSETNPSDQKPMARLTAKVFPENAANQEVIWSSSDPSIATVDSQGHVTGLRTGSATIMAITAEGGFQASAMVYVPLISESFENRATGDDWGASLGTAGGSGNLPAAVASVSGNKVFRLNGGGSGVRSTQRPFENPIVSDLVIIDFDWNVGTPNGSPGVQVSIEDSEGQRYLTLQYAPGAEITYGTGGKAGNATISGTRVGTGFNTNNTTYRVHAELDMVQRTIHLTVENKDNADVKADIEGIPFHGGTTYKDDVGKIQFTLVRSSGRSTSWTTWIDNFNVYVNSAAAEPEPGSFMAGITGPDLATAGLPLDLNIHVSGAKYGVFRALDLTLNYDPSKLEFDLVPGNGGSSGLADHAISSSREGLHVIGTSVWPNEGTIRVLLVSTDVEPVSEDGALFTLHGKVKADAEPGDTSVSLVEWIISEDGEERVIDVSLAAHSFTIEEDQTPVESDKSALNLAISTAETRHAQAVEGGKLGQYRVGAKEELALAIAAASAVRDNARASQAEVDAAASALNAAVQTFDAAFNSLMEGATKVSLGDLAIAVRHYGASTTDPNWNRISMADMFDEGEITIRSLAAIARMILADWES
jgi:uncharacterized protein YjdB